MQTSDAVQRSKLKKVLGWTGGTLAAWIATKIFDSYYDVSLLSAASTAVGTGLANTWSLLGQSFPIQLWMLVGLTVCVLLLLGVGLWGIKDAYRALEDAEKELNAAYAKIAELKAPALLPLTTVQDTVIGTIAIYGSAGKTCPTTAIPTHTDLTFLETDGALDVLESRKMISFEYSASGKYVALSAVGRAYVLHPDFDIAAATAESHPPEL
ncbi:hypothetical protein [Pseudomonas sp. Irchel 3H7]|uniref:hypothetical protein n=1 Tax=Pseudomonas sp. Irchel 3H7 TaxID=2009042 RepID=UPI000BA3241B|nr:hypothetical protein [Pseudomonas sp. Irchel 3H7]